MEGKQRIAFLFVVFFFSGSVVLLAAHELKVRTMQRSDGNRDDAKKLIRELRGDALSRGPGKVVNPEALPTRTAGSYLPENDKKKLNSLLKQVLPSPE
jgi:hypothetical protein